MDYKGMNYSQICMYISRIKLAMSNDKISFAAKKRCQSSLEELESYLNRLNKTNPKYRGLVD
jgi:hypothetical protein